ncbi:MAG: tol-pal system YbgF family protein [Saprospiraceae bacterium]
MKSDLDRQQFIDEYRAGEVSLSDFEKELSSNMELKNELDLYQRDLTAIRSAVSSQLKTSTTEALAAYDKRPTRLTVFRRAMSIAAVFMLVVGSLYVFNSAPSETGSELFAANFDLPAPAAERTVTEQSTSWNEAMTAYANQDFETTIEILSPLVSHDTFQFADRGNLYLGLCLLMTDQDAKAIDALGAIDPESSYQKDAEWYQALAHLKSEDFEKATAALQSIAAQPRHFKHEDAIKLLERIE